MEVMQGAIEDTAGDAIIVDLFEGVTDPSGAIGAVDGALGGAIRALIDVGDLRGKLGDVSVLYPRGAIPAERVLVVGLGPRDEFDLEAARKASAATARRCRKLNVRTVSTVAHGAGVERMNAESAARATVEGALLALYHYREGRDEADGVEQIRLVETDAASISAMRKGVRVAEAMAAGTTLARDLVNGPPNVVTPSHLADAARRIGKEHGLRVHVGDRAWMAEQGMGALLAVAKGAEEPPTFVTLEYGPELDMERGQGGSDGGSEGSSKDHSERSDGAPLVLVGKGITFDSGGLSLKTRTGMITMKSDMGGAAAVLGAMKTIAMLGVSRRVIGILACTENMPDGKAYRPSDVVRAGNGKSIEIISTDAEGRLALADALVHAGTHRPAAVVDVATLTGSCVQALGEGVAAGLFSNDDALARRLEEAGAETFERVWRLPLYRDYRNKIDSDVADMKNSGGAKGGVGTSAVFLQEFVDFPWAHLDIAGVVLSQSASGYQPKGATGFGVRVLAEAVRNWT